MKLLPPWGFALFATSVIFITPLIYVSNKELIDSQIQHASEVVGEQTTQLKNLTAEHTSKGLETVKQYTGDYTAAASEYIGKSRQKIPVVGGISQSDVKSTDFPDAPKTGFPSSAEHTKPLVNAPGGDRVAASAQ